MTTRIKVSLPMLKTRDEAEAAMTTLAAAVNDQRIIHACRDDEVLAVNVKYEASLAEVDVAIKSQTDALRAWAECNPDAFPKDRKSLEMVSGKLGFRTGTPKLSLLSRAFNWERVLALVEQYWPGHVRTKKEVDKESLLSMYSQAEHKPTADEEFKRLGLKVTQEESFFIEPKLTELEARQK